MSAPKVTGAVISKLPPTVILLLSVVAAEELNVSPVSAVVPPKAPVEIVPEPATKEIEVVPSTVLVVIFPALLEPVFNSTAPVAIVSGSEIVIVPPAPAADPPAPAPPAVSIFVSLRVRVVAAVLRVTSPPSPPAPLV